MPLGRMVWALAGLLIGGTAAAAPPKPARSADELVIESPPGWVKAGDRVQIAVDGFDHEEEGFVRLWTCPGTVRAVERLAATIETAEKCRKVDEGARITVAFREARRKVHRRARVAAPAELADLPEADPGADGFEPAHLHEEPGEEAVVEAVPRAAGPAAPPPPAGPTIVVRGPLEAAPLDVQLSSRFVQPGRDGTSHFHGQLELQGRLWKHLHARGGAGVIMSQLIDGPRTPYSGLGLALELRSFAIGGEALIAREGLGGRARVRVGNDRLVGEGRAMYLDGVGGEAQTALRYRLTPASAFWLGVDGSVGDLHSFTEVYTGGAGLRYVSTRVRVDLNAGVATAGRGRIGPAMGLLFSLEI